MFFENTLLDLIVRGFALAAMGIFWVVALIRLNGLRSLSKMRRSWLLAQTLRY